MISFRCKEFFTFLYFCAFNMRSQSNTEIERCFLVNSFLPIRLFHFFFLRSLLKHHNARTGGWFFCCGSRLATYFYLILFNGAYTNWMSLSVWFLKGTRRKKRRQNWVRGISPHLLVAFPSTLNWSSWKNFESKYSEALIRTQTHSHTPLTDRNSHKQIYPIVVI